MAFRLKDQANLISGEGPDELETLAERLLRLGLQEESFDSNKLQLLYTLLMRSEGYYKLVSCIVITSRFVPPFFETITLSVFSLTFVWISRHAYKMKPFDIWFTA